MEHSTPVRIGVGIGEGKPVLGRITGAFLEVMQIFVDEPNRKFTGAEIKKKCDRKAGTVYPLLSRLVARGWIESEWENIDVDKEDRPPRRLYSATKEGVRRAKSILNEKRQQRTTEAPRQAQADPA